jgi:hypothetical protein
MAVRAIMEMLLWSTFHAFCSNEKDTCLLGYFGLKYLTPRTKHSTLRDFPDSLPVIQAEETFSDYFYN